MSLRSQTAFTDRNAQPVGTPPLHIARALMQGGTQAKIELDGRIYDLRITRAGKLILTK